jgi:hypothetical protein
MSDGPVATKTDKAGEKKSPTEKADLGGMDQPTKLSNDEELQHNLGRLVVDPEEARIEFGEERAAKLKKTPDGKWILWPQP